MSDNRSRFETWAKAPPREFDTMIQNAEAHWPGQYDDYLCQCAWEGWQAAEQETARRCAEIAGKLADEYRAKYKGTPVDGIRRGGTYDPHDDGMSDGAAVVEDAIRKEFPEAFK